jgi:hypothetical protein
VRAPWIRIDDTFCIMKVSNFDKRHKVSIGCFQYTLRILVFCFVGFVARVPHVCLYKLRTLAPRRLAEIPNCSGLLVPTLKTCLRVVYMEYGGFNVFCQDLTPLFVTLMTSYKMRYDIHTI